MRPAAWMAVTEIVTHTARRPAIRHQSIKLYGSTGVYNRTDNDFWAVGIAWQFRWGGGL